MSSEIPMNPSWSLVRSLNDARSFASIGDTKEPTIWPSRLSVTVVDDDGEPHTHGECRRSTQLNFMERLARYTPEKMTDYQLMVVETLKELERTRSPELKNMGRLGEVYEDLLIDDIKKAGLYVKDQVIVFIKEYFLSGKVDIIGYDADADRLFITECKSISPYWVQQVIGTPGMIKRGIPGRPKTSHLLQVALYQYHLALRNPKDYGVARLYYVGRAMGEQGEYLVHVIPDDHDGLHYIWYQHIEPTEGPWTKTEYTIESCLDNAELIRQSTFQGKLLPRDFDWILDEETIHDLYTRGKLNASDTDKYAKRLAQIEQNKLNAVADAKTQASWDEKMRLYEEGAIVDGKKAKKPLKKNHKFFGQKRINNLPLKTSKACELCDYREFCFDEDGKPVND